MEVITVQLFKSYFIATSFLLISYAVSLPQFQQSPPSGRLSASTGREQQSRQQMRSPSGSEWAFDSINPMLAGSQSNSGSTHGVRSNRTAMSDEIVFPDQLHMLNGKVKNRGSTNKDNQAIFSLPNNTTPKCVDPTSGSTFCEQIDEYPDSIIADVVQKRRTQFQTFFGDDVVTNELFNRIDDNLRQMSLCVSREQVIFPKLALNKDDIWKYIVNVNETYRQGIRVEQCSKENKACLFSEFFPRPSKATCKQKFIYRKLIAINSLGEPEPDAFMFPSCCSCVLEYNSSDLQLRSAEPETPRAVSALPLGGHPNPRPTTGRPDPRRKINV
ncbi:neurotrophin 1 isoform X2 [Nilaparvata lugens]|uniref:neurotrophin 1 isoform X2 n=1 Tax=Nilaparvata lugens TaxID=108931 RepID=UPI00193D0105|nr:neurotrophin 1 isoform X2 [Nilaparvata lugens]